MSDIVPDGLPERLRKHQRHTDTPTKPDQLFGSASAAWSPSFFDGFAGGRTRERPTSRRSCAEMYILSFDASAGSLSYELSRFFDRRSISGYPGFAKRRSGTNEWHESFTAILHDAPRDGCPICGWVSHSSILTNMISLSSYGGQSCSFEDGAM